jgi:hypothetical protein
VTLTNAYCTLAEFKLELGVNDVIDDAKAESAINTASRQIDAFCSRRFWQDATVKTRRYRAMESNCCVVDDISTTTGLIVKVDEAGDGTFSTTLTIDTHFLLEPLNAAEETPVRPYERIEIVDSIGTYFPRGRRPGVQVTAKFGWPAIPDDVAKACVIQSVLLFKAQDAAFGAAQLGVDGITVFVGQMHRTAAGLLEPYVRRDP